MKGLIKIWAEQDKTKLHTKLLPDNIKAALCHISGHYGAAEQIKLNIFCHV